MQEGKSGRILRRPQQDYPAATVDQFCTAVLSAPISRQAVSRHVSVLTDVGLVTARRNGREVHLSVRPEALAPAAEWLEQIGAAWDDALERLAQQIEGRPD